MKHALPLLSFVVCCLVFVVSAAAGDGLPAGVIQVQVEGTLLTGAMKPAGEKNWTITAAVHAGGKALALDFSKNKTAKKQIKDFHGDPDALTSTARPLTKAHVNGRLEFRPGLTKDGPAIPVIVVESLKIVE